MSDNREGQKQNGVLKYFAMVVLMVFFVILYVWQSVEIMNMKMELREQVKLQRALIKDNDRMIYEIEKFKTMEHIEKYVEDNSLYQLEPENFATIKMD